ncbi:MAG TPA: site-2 protease family protein, partial [Ramlibacter sp.]|nr:site-2 protease family protein [Ramlibacter sp.]
MDWIEHGLVALAIGLPAMLGLMVLVTASRLARLELRRISLSVVAEGSVPAPVRQTLDKARPLLEGLGFEFRYTTASERAIATDGDSLLYTDVYQHVDGRSHALATPSMTPEHGEPCTLMWVTLLEGRRAIATVNCYLHTMVSVPAGWTLHDDYLHDPGQAWEHHKKRIARVKEAIVQDGVEFFRAMKVSTDDLMEHGERQGVVVPEGDHWRMPWRVAVRFAWKLFLGQRKVSKARAAGSSKPTSAVGVEADVEAFQHQQAMLRTTRWSSGKKWKVFLLTAALFLGVGSLWISVTFLPILLVVIGLHEGGHYLAMKISGYRNLSVFFVPGLGGLAMGEKASASPWEKLFVYLAGPMPGIALAVAGLIGQALGAFQPPSWFQEFLIACLIINYLNLLPITPLDGGRIVETFLFARLPVARFIFAALGVAAFAAVGFSTGDKVMLVLAVLVGLSLPHQWRVMRVDRAITRNGSEALDERTAIERVFTALQHPRFAGWP